MVGSPAVPTAAPSGRDAAVASVAAVGVVVLAGVVPAAPVALGGVLVVEVLAPAAGGAAGGGGAAAAAVAPAPSSIVSDSKRTSLWLAIPLSCTRSAPGGGAAGKAPPLTT